MYFCVRVQAKLDQVTSREKMLKMVEECLLVNTTLPLQLTNPPLIWQHLYLTAVALLTITVQPVSSSNDKQCPHYPTSHLPRCQCLVHMANCCFPVVIAIAVINALANKKVSFAELMFANFAIIAVTYFLEKKWLLRHETNKTVVYEKIDLVKPENHHLLIKDLEERTGLKIIRVQVGRIDFLRDVARVKIFFYEDENQSSSFEDTGA